MSHSSISRYNKEKYTEAEILLGILNNNDNMIRYVYKCFYPGIKSMVGSFRNLSLDAEDIFQEGLTRAVINVRDQKFNGTSSFYTYLTSICRNICLKELRRSGKNIETINYTIENVEQDNYQDELIDRMTAVKNKMDEACKQIIDLRFGLQKNDDLETVNTDNVENMKFEEIARQLNIEADNARQRFRRCFEKFKMALSLDHSWRELKK